MGELLAKNLKTSYSEVLCWGNVRLASDHALIHLPKTKTSQLTGDFLDVFTVANKSYCPVSALKALKQMLDHENKIAWDSPIFWESNDTVLTMEAMNRALKVIFKDICLEGVDSITCHSFRAAIPTAVMKLGIPKHEHILKNWGRWSSNCFRTYAKLQTGQKKIMFDNILQTLQ